MKHAISNFHEYSPSLWSGAQPSETDLQTLSGSNVQVIVNISPASAKNALTNEAAIVEKLGMDYIHFPVDCSNLRPIHYKTFSGIMHSVADKRIFVHCGGNIKTSNLIHMYDVLENGTDERESLATLLSIQQPEQKWFTYFQTMGMKGIQTI